MRKTILISSVLLLIAFMFGFQASGILKARRFVVQDGEGKTTIVALTDADGDGEFMVYDNAGEIVFGVKRGAFIGRLGEELRETPNRLENTLYLIAKLEARITELEENQKISTSASRPELTKPDDITQEALPGIPLKVENASVINKMMTPVTVRGISTSNVRVTVMRSFIGKVQLSDMFDDPKQTRGTWLMFEVSITNLQENLKSNYATWRYNNSLISSSGVATLTDNFGNAYRYLNIGYGSNPTKASKNSESIYPGKSITDILIFETPVASATELTLHLPGSNVGVKKDLTITIPVAEIEKE